VPLARWAKLGGGDHRRGGARPRPRRHLWCQSAAVPVRTSAGIVGRGAPTRRAPRFCGAPAHAGRTGSAARPKRRAALLTGRPRVAGSIFDRGARGMWPAWMGSGPPHGAHPFSAERTRTLPSLAAQRRPAGRAASVGGTPALGGQPGWAAHPSTATTLFVRSARARRTDWLGGAPPCGTLHCCLGVCECRAASLGGRLRTEASFAGRRAPARRPSRLGGAHPCGAQPFGVGARARGWKPPWGCLREQRLAWMGGAPPNGGQPGWAARPCAAGTLLGRRVPARRAGSFGGAPPPAGVSGCVVLPSAARTLAGRGARVRRPN